MKKPANACSAVATMRKAMKKGLDPTMLDPLEVPAFEKLRQSVREAPGDESWRNSPPPTSNAASCNRTIDSRTSPHPPRAGAMKTFPFSHG